MNISALRRLSILFTLLCVGAVVTHPGAAVAKGTAPPAAVSTASASSAAGSAASAASAADEHASAAASALDDKDSSDEPDQPGRLDWDKPSTVRHRHRWQHHDNGSVVNIGRSSHLEAGQKAEAVVSILGSSTSDGEAGDVVSVFGNTRVTGPVSENAVAVLGNNYIDAKVDGDVVAVLGSVELGPNAEVGGDVVAVLGGVHRDPGAVVHGSVQRVIDMDIGGVSGLSWLHSWINHCLIYGRPLAFAPGLGWAWTLALGLLAFYACLALMFRQGIDQCVQTLESQPGHTALAALIGILLTPVLLVLLCVTVIGIAAVPFVVGALFCMSLFGKAVMLAWLGGRISGRRLGSAGHPAVAVLIGGAVVLILYVVPVVGFLVYKLLGFFGFGAVFYTLVLRVRARRAANGSQPPSASQPPSGSPPPNAATMAGPGWTASAAPAAGAAAGAGPSIAAEPVPPAYSAPPHTPAPPPATPAFTAAMPRAGFWVRMGALLLDVLLVGFAVSMLHPFGDFHIVVLAIYGAVMWKLRGTTVGGIVFDLHVVRVDGRPVDWETAIVRALGCFLSLCVVFLGFIWIALDPNRQAWHDKIAGTVVVRAKGGSPLL
ncbi:MAG TPA: RDD family protein [Steroidobacteraceae bacterium]|nr:RDD family protein [Steroidobacteraceae bacterium]